MILTEVTLNNFRSYKQQVFHFSPKTTLIIGPNTTGKTNLVEAITMLASGKSFRAGREAEMIFRGGELARIRATIVEKSKAFGKNKDGDFSTKINLEVVLTRGKINGQLAPLKRLLVNNLAKRLADFAGYLHVVLFQPSDLRLVEGSPRRRRHYLDFILSQVDRKYHHSWLTYQKALRQRNKLLWLVREKQAQASQLDYWNSLLIDSGQTIYQKRREFLQFANGQFTASKLSQYNNLQLNYDHSQISQERLIKYARAEMAAGKTLVGPHRDDFEIIASNFAGRNLAVFGSRGEQRMAVLGLKMAELSFIKQKTSDEPLLILDDIFSELDYKNRQQVLNLACCQQTIMTTASQNLVGKTFRDKIKLIKLI